MSFTNRPLVWLLAAPAAWGAQLLLVWWMDARRCAGEVSVPGVRTANVVIALLTLAITLWSLRRGAMLRLEPNGARQYLSDGAALVGFVFAIAVIIGALGGLTLSTCEITR